MIVRPSVTLDARDVDRLISDLAARVPGFVPEWHPDPQDPALAVSSISARYLAAVIQRLNQGPDKGKLAFLDLLGVPMGTARAARAPLVFELVDGAAGGSAPTATQVQAPPPPGSPQQIVFETERAAGITAGRLTQVMSLWPGRDEYIDHSKAHTAGETLMLFDRQALKPTPHHLYLQHGTLLNLQGNVELALEFQLTRPGAEALRIIWEYWDGAVWRGFASIDPACEIDRRSGEDGTNGLTSSGVVRLRTDCAQSSKTEVNKIKGFWIRGRLDQTLPADAAKLLPLVDAIRVSSIVSHHLTARLKLVEPQVRTNAGLLRRRVEVAPLFRIRSASEETKGVVVNGAGGPLKGAVVTLLAVDPDNTTFGEHSADPTDTDGTFVFQGLPSAGSKGLKARVSFADTEQTTVIGDVSGVTTIVLVFDIEGLKLDKAFTDGTPLDTTKPFYPFGQQPQPGTVFYFNSAELFAKPRATFRLVLPRAHAPSDELADQAVAAKGKDLPHTVVWEYYNGREWATLPQVPGTSPQADFDTSEVLDFVVPDDLAPVAVNDDRDLWMRARLASGGYGVVQTVTVNRDSSPSTFSLFVPRPPVLANATLGYAWQYGPQHPDAVLAYNDFQYVDTTFQATWPGEAFEPFVRVRDLTPTVYLGFDKKPPTASLGLLFDIVEDPADPLGPPLVWEYWDGTTWVRTTVDDETANLRLTGIAAVLTDDDSAPLSRFDSSLHWIRTRLKEDGPFPPVGIRRIHPNAVWAAQLRTFRDLQVAQSRGIPAEVFKVPQTPIVEGERLEVREVAGARANVEWRLVALGLAGGDVTVVRQLETLLAAEGTHTEVSLGDIRLRRDKEKRVTEVWVKWTPQPALVHSAANDRHYTIDRARGLLFFGDGKAGRLLPEGAVVLLRSFRSGGGTAGNVDASAITQLLGAVSGLKSVTNPLPAEGGSDGETPDRYRDRAPATVRHRGRAVTPADYEAMAREASAAIAVARALPNRNPAGRRLPGYVTVIVVPKTAHPRPYPSHGLREDVRRYVVERAPADVATRIFVTGPTYYPVNVAATIVPRDLSEAGVVDAAAREALEKFLHPLTGGRSGEGWEFGRGVYLSDVAAVLEGVDGLDYAETIELIAGNQVTGTSLDVPADSLVVAGDMRLTVKGTVL